MINLKVNDLTISKVETVLFDKDGTLSDAHIYWGKIIEMRSWEIVHFYGLEFSQAAKLQDLMGWDASKKRLKPLGPIALVSRGDVIWLIRKYLKRMGVENTFNQLDTLFDTVHSDFLSVSRDYIKILPGVGDFVAKLHKAGVKMGIVTSDSVDNTSYALRVMGLLSFFPLIIGHESTSSTKNTGIPANVAMRELDTYPDKTVVIGDAPIDMEMAKNAVVKAGILVATGQMTREMLVEHSGYLVNSMEDIKIC